MSNKVKLERITNNGTKVFINGVQLRNIVDVAIRYKPHDLRTMVVRARVDAYSVPLPSAHQSGEVQEFLRLTQGDSQVTCINSKWAPSYEFGITWMDVELPIGELSGVDDVDTALTASEREWLEYAIDHMRDDSEPEDLTCANVLETMLSRLP